MVNEAEIIKLARLTWGFERCPGSKPGDYYIRLKRYSADGKAEPPPLHRERFFNYAEIRFRDKSGEA